jgi:acylphosphatase
LLKYKKSMITESSLHKNIRISGRVQGVGFRYSARNMAGFFGVRGFVRNLPDGDVYIEAEGKPLQLEEFINWCRQGPSRARIDFIDVYDGEVMGFKSFEVRP